ncbi:acetate/propionate family kinase [Rhodoligotrophos ferricapiens]|uniref:acetate/propionate family kinase n=1 Tax=Rhodoligotrophos ferricapiens TaxID=3069264 RepID=UPI00315CC874
MASTLALTVNPGSSTIKFAGFPWEQPEGPAAFRAKIDFSEQPPRLSVSGPQGQEAYPVKQGSREDLAGIMREVLEICEALPAGGQIAAIGHRVVHGGRRFTGPARITRETLADIEALVPLAPLHQPQSVALIKAVAEIRPELAQIASFDTAFHRTQSEIARRFAIPRALHDEGVQRYGFHGLSYAYIAGRLQEIAPDVAKGRVVIAHLGSGASLCGLKGGLSVDTTMGFSTLDGLPMSSRCGALDPGVILHLLQQRGLDADAIEDLLYHRSGLLGVSGLSGDTRVLVERSRDRGPEARQAREAIDLFCFHIARQTAVLANSIGGLDAVVFTAGIGENQPQIRAGACMALAWLGVEIDPRENARNATRIDSRRMPVSVFVIPTDEEWMIAREMRALCA